MNHEPFYLMLKGSAGNLYFDVQISERERTARDFLIVSTERKPIW